jgi:hypothetical protein
MGRPYSGIEFHGFFRTWQYTGIGMRPRERPTEKWADCYPSILARILRIKGLLVVGVGRREEMTANEGMKVISPKRT